VFNIHLPAYDAQLRCNLLDCQLLHQTGDDGNTPPIVKPARQIDSPVRTEAPKLTRSQNTAEDNSRSKSQHRQCPLSRRANINTNKNTSVSMRDKQC